MTNYIYICRQIKIFAMLYTKEEIQNWYWMPNTKVSFVQPMIVKFFMKYCSFAADSRLPLYFVPVLSEPSVAYKGFETKNDKGYVPCITEESFLCTVHDYLMSIEKDYQAIDDLHNNFFEYVKVNSFNLWRCELTIEKSEYNGKLYFKSRLIYNGNDSYYPEYDDTKISAIESLIKKLVRNTIIQIVDKS